MQDSFSDLFRKVCKQTKKSLSGPVLLKLGSVIDNIYIHSKLQVFTSNIFFVARWQFETDCLENGTVNYVRI